MPDMLDSENKDVKEEKRLAALEQYDILDTEDEKIFDDLTQLAAYICQTPIALISLVDSRRQWFKSKVGLNVSETDRKIAFCQYTIKDEKNLFIVNDALKDLRFAENPLVTGDPSIRFYTGAPITTAEGYALGAVCVIDRQPRELTEDQNNALQIIARQAMNLLENRRVQAEKARLQKQFEAEQKRIIEQESSARKLAEETNIIKDNFLATVSHELRTPLNAILGWAKLAGAGRLDAAAQARAIETIIRSANSQAQLIEDLLDISRIISGKLRLDIRPIELPPIIEAAIDSISLAAEAKSIHIQKIIDPKAAAITGDAERLQQIFWNLLSNAIKFTPKDGKIQIRLERVNSHLEVSISDNGQGISREFLPYVFDHFRQADGASTRLSGGLGLGLAIVKNLVELHGGSISAESDGLGGGSIFTVTLPLRISNSSQLINNPEQAHLASGTIPLETEPLLKGIRVVVIDDEEDARFLLREIFSQSGAEVTLCSTVAEVIEAVQTVHPHILISDIGMPGEDGYSLIKKVRDLAPGKGGQTPAIALTGYARVEDRIKVLSAGFQMFIPKPLEPTEMIAAVGSLARMSGKPI